MNVFFLTIPLFDHLCIWCKFNGGIGRITCKLYVWNSGATGNEAEVHWGEMPVMGCLVSSIDVGWDRSVAWDELWDLVLALAELGGTLGLDADRFDGAPTIMFSIVTHTEFTGISEIGF